MPKAGQTCKKRKVVAVDPAEQELAAKKKSALEKTNSGVVELKKERRVPKKKARKDEEAAALDEAGAEAGGKPKKAASKKKAKGGGKKEAGSDFIKAPSIEDDGDDLGEPEGLASFTPKDLAAPGKKVKASVQTAAKLKGAAHQKTPGVVYLGHIPHGFYEDEMRGFFGQFGDITKLRLARNKKSGNSRGFAFIEFEDAKASEEAYFKMENVLIDERRIHVDFSQSVGKLWNQFNRGES
eukprot:SAG22_NODE_3269_length_1819_cov_1.131395_2_plen_238_part_01